MNIAWKNVLFSTHTKPTYMPPPRYGDQMVVCGPHYRTRQDGDGSFASVQTPHRRAYDLASLIAALPARQKPGIVIVRVDAGMENIPENLAAIDVPKLAILGDSHHMQAPIQNLVNYALRQRFDYLILDHNKQHAHWYLEAGLRNVVWIPALLLAREFLAPVANPDKKITFIGQLGSNHPHRSRLIRHIQSVNLPLSVDSVPQQLAAGRYNRSAITLNCSLNGDFNLRVFETLAAGGMLMTDRLSPLSGLYSLFSEGEDFVHFDSHADFVEKAEHYLAHPAERNLIARRGFRRISTMVNMQSRIRTLDKLVDKGEIDPLFSINSDQRIRAYGCRSKADLYYRIGVYEWVQEQHRCFDAIRVINTGSGDIRMICDFADLPRLSLFSSAGEYNLDIVNKSGLGTVISFFCEADQPPAAAGKTLVIVSSSGLDKCFADYDPDAVVIANFHGLDEQNRTTLANRCGVAGYETGPNFRGLAYRRRHWQHLI